MTFPEVSITFTRYREPDWLVDEALDSLGRQQGVVGEVIFLDQNWNSAFAETVEARSSEQLSFRCIPCEERCLSYARNEGLRHARSDLVLFTEPDALAEPDWARRLADELLKGAAIAGSRILPKWRGRPPILAKAKTVLDQYSMLDWGEQTIEARRVVGAGFGVNKTLLDFSYIFDERFGRRDGELLGGEESDLCRRVLDAGGRISYAGGAVIRHQVLPDRLTWRWAMRRLYFAGASRRQMGGAPSPSKGPGVWDWLFLPIILPPYVYGFLSARRPHTAERSMAYKSP